MVARPVSRVIIRDPDATADDFVELASRLGLHGTDYVVGWTAWLDLAPMGVNKASGLAHVAEQLGTSARPTCWPSATGATTSRCSSGPAAASRWDRRSRRCIDAADDVTETVYDDGAALEIARWFPPTPAPDAGAEQERRAPEAL